MVTRRLARVRAARMLGGLGGALAGVVGGLLGAAQRICLPRSRSATCSARSSTELPSRRDRFAATPSGRHLGSATAARLRAAQPCRRAAGGGRRDHGDRPRSVPSDRNSRTSATTPPGARGRRRDRCSSRRVSPHRGTHDPPASPAVLRPARWSAPTTRCAPSSMHCVFGGGFAIVAVIASGSLWNAAAFSEVHGRAVGRAVARVVFSIAAFVSWFGLRVAPWLVRRPYAAMPAAAR